MYRQGSKKCAIQLSTEWVTLIHFHLSQGLGKLSTNKFNKKVNKDINLSRANEIWEFNYMYSTPHTKLSLQKLQKLILKFSEKKNKKLGSHSE